MDLEILGLALIILGFVIATIGVLAAILRGGGERRVEGGGVIVIGPIPIVFGSSQRAAGWLIILAIILFLMALLFSMGGVIHG